MIAGLETLWAGEAERYDCPEGHTLLIVETAEIDEIDDVKE
jgi:hypothetical protein